MEYYTQFKSPICDIILVGNPSGITNLELLQIESKRSFVLDPAWELNDSFFMEAKRELLEYLSGKRQVFNLKLNPQGTVFQKKVWNALLNIPYGMTKSYKEIATEVGNEKGARAVGMANQKNPIPLMIPCHRVIGSDGSLTGFAYGIELKKQLLQLEHGYKDID